MKKILFIFLSISLFSARTVSAQVVINEILPNPTGDDSGAEWVELYNTGTEITPLANCVLYLHSSNNNQKVIFTDEDFIEKFKVVSWDDSWLNNSGDQVRFECNTLNDTVSYGDGGTISRPDENISIGRSPDGVGQFVILSSLTVNEPNSLPPTATIAPTATFTPTPKPSNTATSTPTTKPSKTLTPTTKKEASSSFTPTNQEISPTETESLLEEEGNDAAVFGIRDISSEDISPTSILKEQEERKKSRLIPGILIISGIGLSGAAIYPIFRRRRLGYNLKDEEVN